MTRAVALVLVAACGASAPLGVTPRSTLAPAFGDAVAFERLVRGQVTVGGLWFADPTCAEFTTPQEVVSPRTKALARCLATLPFVESKRIDALGDVTILTYAPGFEVEARVISDADGARLTWIGYEAARDDKDRAPTISADVLETLRTAGDKNGGLEPAVVDQLVRELPAHAPSRAARAWFKVCIDTAGNIVNIEPRLVTSLGARDAFLAGANAWGFRPFAPAGTPLAICAMSRMVAPLGAAPPEETLPVPAPPSQNGSYPLLLPESTLKRRTGEVSIAPDDKTKVDIQRSQLSRISGTFQVCVDRTGQVESVLPSRSTGVPAYDRTIELRVRSWTYEPFVDASGPVPACTSVTFAYSQR